jgi:hypothetical protein
MDEVEVIRAVFIHDPEAPLAAVLNMRGAEVLVEALQVHIHDQAEADHRSKKRRPNHDTSAEVLHPRKGSRQARHETALFILV